ncbi:kelch-like protein 7 [Gadus chalcogrammus]|uniref:kelch-like protein 7 n=1 Tax=Gadus chalcogrammus TaxID=1042646 RepID=UPI0024C48D6D|nr:kelch-like protein 7 [Gadus chalcogrammus]
MTGAVASPQKASCTRKNNERKCAIKEEYRQLSSMLGVMNNLRKQGTLCDVILVVQGKHFHAHRVVLAAASHYFNLMFTTSMLESLSKEVELRSAEPEIIEMLVEFVYTARISVNSSNVQSLLDAANQYQIEPVKKMCIEFLKGQVDATNCLGISALAACMDCPDLKGAAEDFVQIHFTEVYKLDEFLQLDVAQLTHLLQLDQLTVRAEAQIYDAAMRWLKYDACNRQRHMVKVLGCVRFPLVSKTFLSKTVQAEPLIQDNPQCLKMVIGGMRYHLLSLEDREDLGESSRSRRKKHDYRIALFGGSQPQSCRYFNPKDSSWTDIRCPFEKRRDATVVFWDNVVYILGGSQLFPIKRMDCYNVLKDSWYSKLGPPTSRDSLAACASQGKIYTSGGSEVGSSALDLFECYDTRTETWKVKASMLMARCSHGSAEASGLIYVCGGTRGNNVSGRILNNCEVYDPSTQQWRELCGMIESRKNHGLVVVNHRLYAIGGQGAAGGLDSVEYYDIASNEWCAAAPMPWRGLTVKCAAVGDIIYVLAGFQGVGRLGHVLEYHTESDRWVTYTSVRAFPVTSCLICVVDTCGVNEEEDMDLVDSQTHAGAKAPAPPAASSSLSSEERTPNPGATPALR